MIIVNVKINHGLCIYVSFHWTTSLRAFGQLMPNLGSFTPHVGLHLSPFYRVTLRIASNDSEGNMHSIKRTYKKNGAYQISLALSCRAADNMKVAITSFWCLYIYVMIRCDVLQSCITIRATIGSIYDVAFHNNRIV